MEYQFASQEYVEAKLRPELYEALYTPLVNLSAILGDINGKIGRKTTSNITKDLVLTTPGLLMFGQPIIDLLQKTSSNLSKEEFQPQVTYSSYKILNQLKANDLSLVSDIDIVSILVDFEQFDIKSIEMQIALSSIYLDVFVLYQEMLKTTEQVGVENMTLQELGRLIHNIRCVSNTMETMTYVSYDYLRVLRDLVRTLSYVVSMEWLFTNTYTKRVREYRNKVDGKWRF